MNKTKYNFENSMGILIQLSLLLVSLNGAFAAGPSTPVLLDSVSPNVASAGTVITLNGSGFSTARITAVKFTASKLVASFNILSTTKMTVVLPADAASGPIVLTGSNINTASPFPVTVIPVRANCSPLIDPTKELVITDLSVVNSTRTLVDSAGNPGHWSFLFLMGNLAGETNYKNPVITSNFVKAWLSQFVTVNSVPKVNGNPVTPRPLARRLIDNWPKLSDGSTLNFAKAPFRLLAITNRVDLQNSKQAGEGRFVWGMLDPSGNPLSATVIFEYALPLNVTNTMANWIQRWHNIPFLPFSTVKDDRFNSDLQAITDVFTSNTFSGFVRGIALNQLRTNEVAFGSPWELREFRMNVSTGFLEQAPVKNNPDLSFAFVSAKRQALLDFIASSPSGSSLPATLNTVPLLGASAPVPGNNFGFKWFPEFNDLRNPLHQKVRAFSLNTCNGCHSGEPTTPTIFTHLSVRTQNSTSFSSEFLKKDIKESRIPIQSGSVISNLCR